MTVAEMVALLATGGGVTWVGQAFAGWWTARRDDRRDERATDVKLEEHRDSLTFDLLTAAREEMASLRSEAASLRPLMVHAAHLEESLDHLHALLMAEGDLERKAAERRARAFLKRMRPDVGELRNRAQREVSAATLDGTTDNEGTDIEGWHARKLPPTGGQK